MANVSVVRVTKRTRTSKDESDEETVADLSAGCPCGTGSSYAACCRPLHLGERDAVTAEEVMRARYSAHVVDDLDYLRRSWHPDTCPAIIAASDESERWLGLDIRSTERGGAFDGEGFVEFVATFQAGVQRRALHERSRFVRVSGRWVYIDGVLEF
jgi:SEC-C motif domain protein